MAAPACRGGLVLRPAGGPGGRARAGYHPTPQLAGQSPWPQGRSRHRGSASRPLVRGWYWSPCASAGGGSRRLLGPSRRPPHRFTGYPSGRHLSVTDASDPAPSSRGPRSLTALVLGGGGSLARSRSACCEPSPMHRYQAGPDLGIQRWALTALLCRRSHPGAAPSAWSRRGPVADAARVHRVHPRPSRHPGPSRHLSPLQRRPSPSAGAAVRRGTDRRPPRQVRVRGRGRRTGRRLIGSTAAPWSTRFWPPAPSRALPPRWKSMVSISWMAASSTRCRSGRRWPRRDALFVLQVGRLERPLTQPQRPWEVGLVAFEIARRHRFNEDIAGLPARPRSMSSPGAPRPPPSTFGIGGDPTSNDGSMLPTRPPGAT